MIDVRFHGYPDGRVSMTVCGHAGFGPWGQDILCAAVSTLALTAAQVAEDMHRKNMLREEPVTALRQGFACIHVLPKANCRHQVLQQLRVIVTGMRLLARSYPRYVRVKGRI